MSLSDYNSSRKPRILITNDDGIGAKGLRSLVDYVSDLGDIRVVAPDSARSGQSGAITSGVPLFLEKIDSFSGAEFYACNGTPVDWRCMLFPSFVPILFCRVSIMGPMPE